jgi:hypothetical protein
LQFTRRARRHILRAMPKKSHKRLWTWCAIVLGLLLLLVFVAVPDFPRTAPVSPYSRQLSHAHQLALLCKIYAEDYQGRFPKELRELVPDYLPPENSEELLYFAKIPNKPWYFFGSDSAWYHAAKKKFQKPWHYASGLTEKTPAEWFLIWSPEPYGKTGRRICARCDSSSQIMREEEFRAEMKRQGRERELEETPSAEK